MLDVEFAELSDRGLTREINEDCVGHVVPDSPTLVQAYGLVFALADGVGGMERGEVASQLAIESLTAGFRKIPKGVVHMSLLPKLVQEANLAVYDGGRTDAGLRSRGLMATTVVACALRFDSAVISHVGDSRCYLFREGSGTQLTRDHTLVAEQTRLGMLSETQAAASPNRHILTRSLGSEMFVAADTSTVSVMRGDVLLLCSDGLGYVSDAAIQRIVYGQRDLQGVAQALVAAANDAGGFDNVSVQVIGIKSVARMGLYRGRPYRLL